jgi:hypothetical protein
VPPAFAAKPSTGLSSTLACVISPGYNPDLTDAGLKEPTALKGVEKILLENTKVTDTRRSGSRRR